MLQILFVLFCSFFAVNANAAVTTATERDFRISNPYIQGYLYGMAAGEFALYKKPEGTLVRAQKKAAANLEDAITALDITSVQNAIVAVTKNYSLFGKTWTHFLSTAFDVWSVQKQHTQAHKDVLQIIKLLLEQGALISESDAKHVIEQQDVELVELLAKHAKNLNKQMCLSYAVTCLNNAITCEDETAKLQQIIDVLVNGHLLALEPDAHSKLLSGPDGEIYRNVVHAFYKHYNKPHNPEFVAAGAERFNQK